MNELGDYQFLEKLLHRAETCILFARRCRRFLNGPTIVQRYQGPHGSLRHGVATQQLLQRGDLQRSSLQSASSPPPTGCA